MNLESEAIGFAGFIAYLLTVVVGLRISRLTPAHLVIMMAAFTYLAVLLAALIVGQEILFWNYSAVYCSLTLTFLMLFGATYKSISLRLLLMIHDSEGRAAKYSRLQEELVQQDSFEKRIVVLQESGFANLDGESLVLTDKGRKLANVVSRIQALYRINKSG